MKVPRRTIHFVEHGDEIAIVSLVCEDLAQIDSVAEVIRSVGPSVVYAPLLDGPQISSRWSARYASVLADDHRLGCYHVDFLRNGAALSSTRAGLVSCDRSVERSRTRTPRDPTRAWRQGVLLTVCGNRTTRRSADGRRPIDNATEYFDVAVHQVRASSTGSNWSKSCAEAPAPRVFETDDLTILTGWAQTLLEALAYGPDGIERLLGDARPGAAWRAAFRIGEPTSQLAEALSFMGRSIRAVISLEAGSRLEALQVLCEEDRPGEAAVEKLVRRVLRSTLNQLRAREESGAR